MNPQIVSPNKLSDNQLEQVIELVDSGGQIKIADLRNRLLRAELIAIIEINNIVVCTAALKIPLNSYINKVFSKAKVTDNSLFTRELGYIATHCDYEGKGYCKNLIKEFMQVIQVNSMFATTRKPAMIHILIKNGFNTVGQIYDDDLQLLTYQF